jgi:hypothetical protein
MEIVSDIRLRYASTKVTSKVVNPAIKAQEATFHVVLPDTAFISGFLMYVIGFFSFKLEITLNIFFHFVGKLTERCTKQV